jgi:hypothetical protein
VRQVPLVRLHLVPLLPEYLAHHPDISIDLVLSDQLVDLVAEKFDIAISSSPLATANLIRRELVPIRWSMCAAPTYLESSGTPTRPDELRRHNCIYYASAAVRGDLWTFKQKGESHTVQVKGLPRQQWRGGSRRCGQRCWPRFIADLCHLAGNQRRDTAAADAGLDTTWYVWAKPHGAFHRRSPPHN